jgi:RNase H-fold protein (predicted Holliday junction resolvase)
MSTDEVAQDVAQGSSMLHNTQELSAITFNSANREILRITHDGRLVCGEGLSADAATQEAAKMLITAFDEQIKEMVDSRIAVVTARAESAEAECVEWRRLLQMSRDDREHDLEAELAAIKKATK